MFPVWWREVFSAANHAPYEPVETLGFKREKKNFAQPETRRQQRRLKRAELETKRGKMKKETGSGIEACHTGPTSYGGGRLTPGKNNEQIVTPAGKSLPQTRQGRSKRGGWE